MMMELSLHRLHHGTCNVRYSRHRENDADRRALAIWVNNQRMMFNRNLLAPERILTLLSLGFNFNSHDAGALSILPPLALALLLPYCERQHAAPNGMDAGVCIRVLLTRLHAAHSTIIISPSSEWEAKFAELRKWRDNHGDLNVPQRLEGNAGLGQWLSTQR